MKNWKKLHIYLPLLAAAAVGAGTLTSLAGYTPPVFEVAEKPVIDLTFLDALESSSDAAYLETSAAAEALEGMEVKEASSAKKTQKKKRSVPAELLATAAGGAAADGEASAPVEAIAEPSLYRDGTYTGAGTGFNGPITVSVTVSGGRIAGIAVVSASDNEPFLSNAKTLLSRILGAQTTNVDTVSGATYSSRGLIWAVRDALAKAGGMHLPATDESPAAVTPTVSESKPSESEETIKPGKKGQFPYPDGTYLGEGEGRNGMIKIRLTLKDETISAIEVVEQGEDAAFFERAAKVIGKILKMQSPTVDSVSGATLSSEGIKEAVLDALEKAKAAVQKSGDEKDSEEEGEAKPDSEWPEIPKKLRGRFPYPDGVYTGYGDGRNGEIAVKVVLLDKTVQRILVTKQQEDPAYYKRAVAVLSDVLMGQTIEVDSVSGATLSSEGLLDAIADALENARAAVSPTPTGVVEATPTPVPEENTPTPEPPSVTPTPEPTLVTPTPESPSAAPTLNPEENTPTPAPGEVTGTPVPGESTPTPGQEVIVPTVIPGEITPTPVQEVITPTLVPGEMTPTSGPGEITPTPVSTSVLTPTPGPSVTPTSKPTAAPKPTVTPMPTTKPTATPKPTGAFVDGTYTASARVSPDAWEDFDAYTLKVTVTIKDDMITSVTAPTTGIDTGNHFYINRALNGTRTKPGIPAQAAALGKLTSTDSLKIDVVSSATCSSKGLIEGIRKALDKAKRT